MTNHNTDLSVKQMVLNRLPFLADSVGTTTLLSNFTLEVMYELEPCFRVRFDDTGAEDMTRVGDEDNYGTMQRSIIADLVSIYVLMTAFITTSAGSTGSSTSALTTYLKRAKAGSVEVEYDQFDLKRGLFAMEAGSLLTKYKADIMRKCRSVGCVFDICDDCTIKFANANVVPPFGVFGSDCGCS